MTARTVTIYKNGDTHFPGKKLVVNNRQIRSFDSFLDKVTRTVRNPVAVRSIRTPNHGTQLVNLEKFEDGGIYVAVGQERFKKLNYTNIQGLQHHPPTSWNKSDQLPPLKPIRTRFTNTTARHLQVGEDDARRNRIIYVYRNGDANHPCVKLLLDKRVSGNLDKVLECVTNKVKLETGAVKNLYSLDGRLVENVGAIESGGKYVAVGWRPFKSLEYENIVAKSAITPRKNKFIPKKLPQLSKSSNLEKYKEFKEKKRSEIDTSLQVLDKSVSDDDKDKDDDDNNWLDDIVDKIEDVIEKSPSPPPVSDRLKKSPSPEPAADRSALNTPDPDDIDNSIDLGTTQTLAANTDGIGDFTDGDPNDDASNSRDNSPRKAVPAGPSGPAAFEHAVSATQKSSSNSASQDAKKSPRNSVVDAEPAPEMESFRKAASKASSRASGNRSSRTRTLTKSIELKEDPADEPAVEPPQEGRASADNARAPSGGGRVSGGGEGAYKASGIEAESGTAINDSKDTTTERTIDDVAAEEVEEEVEEEMGDQPQVAADAPVEVADGSAVNADSGTSYIA